MSPKVDYVAHGDDLSTLARVQHQRPSSHHIDSTTFDDFGGTLDANSTPKCAQATPIFVKRVATEQCGHFLKPDTKERVPRHARNTLGARWRPAQVQADAHDDSMVGPCCRCLRQDARQLRVPDKQVIGPLQFGHHCGQSLHRSRSSDGNDLREGVRVAWIETRTKQHRHQKVRPRWCIPGAIETTPPLGLMISDQHTSVGCAGGRRSQQIGVGRTRFGDVIHVPVIAWPSRRTVDIGARWAHAI